ncbi:MAG: hypothetical protein ISS48_03725 [Candidatus Aenigmarchaeota archaeon]|nr:hypothetical protein [Candidatus Aenigmarchaeota archaeon]
MRWYLPGTWAENIGRAKRLTPYISLRRLRIWGHSIGCLLEVDGTFQYYSITEGQGAGRKSGRQQLIKKLKLNIREIYPI